MYIRIDIYEIHKHDVWDTPLYMFRTRLMIASGKPPIAGGGGGGGGDSFLHLTLYHFSVSISSVSHHLCHHITSLSPPSPSPPFLSPHLCHHHRHPHVLRKCSPYLVVFALKYDPPSPLALNVPCIGMFVLPNTSDLGDGTCTGAYLPNVGC